MYRSDLEQRVDAARSALALAIDHLDPDAVPASEAVRVFDGLEQIARTATAARTLLARRVEDSMEWKRLGFASAAEHLAAKSGSSLGAAKTQMETSNALRDLPQTTGQLLNGLISGDQGAVVAGAAKHNPGAEAALLAAAKRSNLQELRNEAAKARAAADTDPDATHARLHRERRATRFTDEEGARSWRLRGPVDELSEFDAEVDRLTDEIFRRRGTAGPRESRDAYALDATVEMARRSARADDGASNTGRQPRPAHLALLRLDISALWRGHVEGDELCEVTGLGPIPVNAAKRLLGDAVLKLIITKGVDVAHVTSLTRGPTQAMRYALLWTSPTCSVEGCSRTIIEYDHVHGAEFKDTRHTRLDETRPVCQGHHDLHTTLGWALLPGTGQSPMVPPDDPRHPAHHGPGAAPPSPHGPGPPGYTGSSPPVPGNTGPDELFGPSAA